MNDLISKWAELLHQQDIRETKTNRISSAAQDILQYRQFIADCKKLEITDIDITEDIWFIAHKWANELY